MEANARFRSLGQMHRVPTRRALLRITGSATYAFADRRSPSDDDDAVETLPTSVGSVLVGGLRSRRSSRMSPPFEVAAPPAHEGDARKEAIERRRAAACEGTQRRAWGTSENEQRKTARPPPPVAFTAAFPEDSAKKAPWSGFVRKSGVGDAGILTETIAAVRAFAESLLASAANGTSRLARGERAGRGGERRPAIPPRGDLENPCTHC